MGSVGTVTTLNTTGASQRAVDFFTQGVERYNQFLIGRVKLSETAATSYTERPKAENPRDKELESELSKLAEANGYYANFQTETSTKISRKVAGRVQGTQTVYRTQIKKRIMTLVRR